MNLKMQDLEYVRTIAQIEAQHNREDQVIIPTYYGRHRGFRFLPRREWVGGVVEIVRYTPEDKRGEVLRDNGNREPGIADRKPGKSKKVRKS